MIDALGYYAAGAIAYAIIFTAVDICIFDGDDSSASAILRESLVWPVVLGVFIFTIFRAVIEKRRALVALICAIWAASIILAALALGDI